MFSLYMFIETYFLHFCTYSHFMKFSYNLNYSVKWESKWRNSMLNTLKTFKSNLERLQTYNNLKKHKYSQTCNQSSVSNAALLLASCLDFALLVKVCSSGQVTFIWHSQIGGFLIFMNDVFIETSLFWWEAMIWYKLFKLLLGIGKSHWKFSATTNDN